MSKPREYFKFNFSKVVKFDCTCGRRYINTDKCLQETDSRMPQTRADVIRSMNDEELADYLYRMALCSLTTVEVDKEEVAIPKLLKYLQSEAE